MRKEIVFTILITSILILIIVFNSQKVAGEVSCGFGVFPSERGCEDVNGNELIDCCYEGGSGGTGPSFFLSCPLGYRYYSLAGMECSYDNFIPSTYDYQISVLSSDVCPDGRYLHYMCLRDGSETGGYDIGIHRFSDYEVVGYYCQPGFSFNTLSKRCDGSGGSEPVYCDNDGDGHYSTYTYLSCLNSISHSLPGDDCDDSDPDTYPGADEPDCSTKDLNCDGTIYEARLSSELCNKKDDDCDGLIDEASYSSTPYSACAYYYPDNDGDGYPFNGDPLYLSRITRQGYYLAIPDPSDGNPPDNIDFDCDDNNNAIHPNAFDVCDFIDQDCDGSLIDGCGGYNSAQDYNEEHDEIKVQMFNGMNWFIIAGYDSSSWDFVKELKVDCNENDCSYHGPSGVVIVS